MPSPKSHAQAVTDPSGSVLASLNVQVKLVQLDVNAAVGDWFDGAVQLTVNGACDVPPAGTEADCDAPGLAVQLDAMPLRATV